MTATSVPVAFTVDPWDPGYGLAYNEELDVGALEESSAELNLDLEVPAAQWRPITPDPAPRLPGTVLFLDGVRRIDARIWVHGRNPQPAPGIAASLAAGLVCCDGAARVGDVAVERGLFTSAPEATDIITHSARYVARLAGKPGLDQLSLALQQRLANAEVQLALAFRAQHPAGDDLLVVDGPLRGRTHLDRTVGYIKTHHASYLPARAGSRRGGPQSRPANPCLHDGHLLAAQLLVSPATRSPWRALVGHRPHGMLSGTADSRRDQARRLHRPAPATPCQLTAQGSARPAKPGAHRRARTRTPPQARRPATALPCTPRRSQCRTEAR